MPRYFLHQIHKGQCIPDTEGGNFDSLDAVRNEAVLSAREIMAERLMAGHDLNHSKFEVKDDAGRVVLVMPFSEAMSDELKNAARE